MNSEDYLKNFVLRINNEFTKSLPTSHNISQRNDSESQDDDLEIEDLLLEGTSQTPKQETPSESSQEMFQVTTDETKISVKKSPTNEKPVVLRKFERPKQKIPVSNEKITEKKLSAPSETSDKDVKEYAEVDSAGLYTEDEEQMDDDGNIFGEEISEEIYDIMEIENEATDNIYLDESGKQVMGDDEGGEFILVNFKSSNEDLTEKEQQFVVEELYDDEASDSKPVSSRKKHVNRMPREIINKYAQSTENNQHICTKCIKVFSTRTNLIRHIQSHDGYKAYRCDICNKGFTQSGSLKQHKYIHSGERPYKCEFCDRAFTQGKTLKFHLRRHTEEKPFICTHCNSAFRQRDGLKRHLKSRHNIELKYERHNQLSDKLITYAVETDEGGNNKESVEMVVNESKKD